MNVPLYPLLFQPRFKERVWGGRKLEQLYQKALPPGVPVGESWEVSDRPGDSSEITNGALAGKDLHWLMTHYSEELLGRGHRNWKTFPLLIKILDAQDTLSLQVHPPRHKAAELGGEPKTEMWYIAQAEPGAELFVGLKQGITRAEFETRIKQGSVAECFHRVKVVAGDVMFLPSGRVHALGAGMVIFEIQQNSDTTYRVFDWNRQGLDGKPRALHIEESLASIDFNDFEPALVQSPFKAEGNGRIKKLVSDPLFDVELWEAPLGSVLSLPDGGARILGVVQGRLEIIDGPNSVALAAGQFCLVPASLGGVRLSMNAATLFLKAEAGQG